MTFTSLTSACARAGQWALVEELYNEMREGGILPDFTLLNRLQVRHRGSRGAPEGLQRGSSGAPEGV
jgi:pentatricopeptide repeat protein